MEGYIKLYKRRRRRRILFKLVCVVFLIVALCLFTLLFVNSRIMPSVLEIANIYSKNRVNHAINDALQAFIEQNSLVSEDFYMNSTMPNGFSVNTILINQICAQLAVEITELLAQRRGEKVSVPIGMITGIDMLASLGPNINVAVVPMGEARVDFETNFISVGINQVNFQIWLNIESTIGLVTPLQTRRITMTRRVALVDTVYSGEIPQFFFAPQQ